MNYDYSCRGPPALRRHPRDLLGGEDEGAGHAPPALMIIMITMVIIVVVVVVVVVVVIIITIVIRGWSNTVGNLNEGFRVTKEIYRVLLFFFLGGVGFDTCLCTFRLPFLIPHILSYAQLPY